MKNFIAVFFTTILVLPFFSCGKKGEILPPLIRFPQPVENFEVVQKADRIRLTWLNPNAYEDGSPLSVIEKIEIWVLEEVASEVVGTAEMPAEEFEQKAAILATITQDRIQDYTVKDGSSPNHLIYPYEFSGKDYLTKKFTFGVRVKGKKRYSPFSVLLSIKPEVLPLPPEGVEATVFADRIEVKWSPPLKNRDQSIPPNLEGYNIYRSEEEGESRRLNTNLVEAEKFDDENFEFHRVYRYFVRASANASHPFLESENSEEIEILPKDTFAPDRPKGLISVAGQDVLSITWDANMENDLDGYRVWRREEGKAEVHLLTPDLIKENAYNDASVNKGTGYIYFVTALDKAGNESQRSETISDRIREIMR
jgi:hypothetical protein